MPAKIWIEQLRDPHIAWENYPYFVKFRDDRPVVEYVRADRMNEVINLMQQDLERTEKLLKEKKPESSETGTEKFPVLRFSTDHGTRFERVRFGSHWQITEAGQVSMDVGTYHGDDWLDVRYLGVEHMSLSEYNEARKRAGQEPEE